MFVSLFTIATVLIVNDTSPHLVVPGEMDIDILILKFHGRLRLWCYMKFNEIHNVHHN